MWKNKVNNRRTIASQVNGYSNASDIATVFAKRFHQACLPNSLECISELRLKFEAKLHSYTALILIYSGSLLISLISVFVA